MASVTERPPDELDGWWLAVWRHALRVLKAQESWEREQRPLLDEYVFALRESTVQRQAAEADPYHETDKGLLHPHPGFVISDRAARRAVLLADALLLTPESRRAHGLADGKVNDGTASEFAGL